MAKNNEASVMIAFLMSLLKQTEWEIFSHM